MASLMAARAYGRVSSGNDGLISSSDGEGRRIRLLPVTEARVYEASRVTGVVRKSEVSLDGRKVASFLTKHVITSTCPSNR